MNQYKVICLAVGGLNKKIFGPGEIVSENQFPAGNAEKLVASGHLVRHGAAVVKVTPVIPATTETPYVKPAMRDITVSEIKEILTQRGVDFENAKNKSDLYSLL